MKWVALPQSLLNDKKKMIFKHGTITSVKRLKLGDMLKSEKLFLL
jgi:hypothetical protein